MKIGYARVSTLEQNLDLQLRALEKTGCKKIFREKVSGSNRERPQFQRMLDQIRVGDTIVVETRPPSALNPGPLGNDGNNSPGWWKVSVAL